MTGFIGAQAWVDNDHLLLVRYSYASKGRDVVRVDMFGTNWRTTPLDESPEDRRPYTLGGNR